MTQLSYPGKELELFRAARHWKAYWSSVVRPWIQGDVLEVGAGLGTNTALMMNARVTSWTCLEPDDALAQQLQTLKGLPIEPRVIAGTITAIPAEPTFDAIVYIDVVEHIEDDALELTQAASRLREKGHIVVLSPAHQWLFSPFDHSIGHYRRYDKSSLAVVGPASCQRVQLFYLDSIGLLASFANKMFLRKSMPTPADIAVWDNYMVPASRALDSVLGHTLGKTIVGVWQKV